MNYKNFFCFTLLLLLGGASCKTGKPDYFLFYQQAQVLPVTLQEGGGGIDTTLLQLIAPYKDSLDKQMNEIVAYATVDFMKRDSVDALGRMIAKQVLSWANDSLNAQADISLFNRSGFRTSIYQGEVTLGKVYQVMPFDNSLVIASLTAEGVREMLNYLGRRKEPVAGMEMTMIGDKVIQVKVNGELLDETRTYRVLTSDYLYNGGSRMDFFQQSTAVKAMPILLREAILKAFQRSGRLLPIEEAVYRQDNQTVN
ncbi:5'-nucleotidase C-terminal domain-containing protein [Algivirga pacifica]|uniref:5'-Nucleotidase C-terminal domain-containing protein n=1 Tax=Algivirga pacifica TaxID=1162670 RepID=A0ABP9CX69_9BACT